MIGRTMAEPVWMVISNPKSGKVLGWVKIESFSNPDETLGDDEREVVDWAPDNILSYATERVYWDEIPARLDRKKDG